MKIKHLNQDCGSSCGPTSLKMLMSTINYKDNLSIQDIFSMGKTKVGGAPWYRMTKIINDLNIKHKILSDTTTDYFKNKPSNIKWMVAVYYSNQIKHWVVLSDYNEKDNTFLILDPAGDESYISKKELEYMYNPRNGLVIEFDMDDFIGTSFTYNYPIMDSVDDNEFRLNLDSNWIFGLNGSEVTYDTLFNESNKDFTFSIVKHSEVNSEDYKHIFGYNDRLALLIDFKWLDIDSIYKLSRSSNIYS